MTNAEKENVVYFVVEYTTYEEINEDELELLGYTEDDVVENDEE